MNDQRGAPRSRTLLPARISYNNGQANFDTVVRDLSDAGARLKVSQGITLPDTFRLHLTKSDEWHQVRLRWRRDDLAGVHFAVGQAGADEEMARMAAHRIRELEAEVVKLRRVLDEMRADPGRIMQLLDKVG